MLNKVAFPICKKINKNIAPNLKEGETLLNFTLEITGFIFVYFVVLNL